MHEMALVKSIAKAVIAHAEREGASRVESVTLLVGEMRDFHEEMLDRMFAHFTRSTLAEGAHIEMKKVPITYSCKQCGSVFRFNMGSKSAFLCECHPEADVVIESGTELIIEEIRIAL